MRGVITIGTAFAIGAAVGCVIWGLADVFLFERIKEKPVQKSKIRKPTPRFSIN